MNFLSDNPNSYDIRKIIIFGSLNSNTMLVKLINEQKLLLLFWSNQLRLIPLCLDFLDVT